VVISKKKSFDKFLEKGEFVTEYSIFSKELSQNGKNLPPKKIHWLEDFPS
jgi:hypothetical protein